MKKEIIFLIILGLVLGFIVSKIPFKTETPEVVEEEEIEEVCEEKQTTELTQVFNPKKNEDYSNYGVGKFYTVWYGSDSFLRPRTFNIHDITSTTSSYYWIDLYSFRKEDCRFNYRNILQIPIKDIKSGKFNI